MQEFLDVMKALADPSRVKIIKMLQHRSDMCVCELRSALGLAQPTVSKHLKVLEGAGLLTRKKDGQWVNYALRREAGSYAAAMLDNLDGWLNDTPDIRDVLDKLPHLDRLTICGAPTGPDPADPATADTTK
ncbi:ArsR/SmtB family transcription factor [Desulfobaculum sp. SPO524]|uniref:ArsR/SmtB family transcription factor n=1 Tax=Desulfobaculum sp. SPO524 TaxID=3378071 RepID=UPI003852CA65